MHPHLQTLFDFIQKTTQLSPDEKEALLKSVKNVDKELEITLFKLDRTDKVKKTTAILLEETIGELEQKRKTVEDINAELQKSLTDLKAAQAQLIQSEKMASLGELTAGIAHEIQNPLNFVNNFSEVNKELIEEMGQELEKGNLEDAKAIAKGIKENEEKIMHHGKRADAIVKGMLLHSRTSTSIKEPTDINALADEYLRLAYHGLRAKDKTFNAQFETDFDPSLPKLNIVPQDIGRVPLNLINNAFYACSQRANVKRRTLTDSLQSPSGQAVNGNQPEASGQMPDAYHPTVIVSTKSLGDKIEIRVQDNGPGIPDSIKDKIFQPFFTTKPTGQGTGLGLSLAYDIVTKGHAGELHVETQEGVGTAFVITLPV